MSDPSSLSPIWFPIFFVGLWLLIGAFFALTSGWLSLADRFRATSKPKGEKVPSQVKQVGMVPENRVTHLIISDRGLYLYPSLLFRFLHPPLLIPWNEMRLVHEGQTLWWYTFQLDLANITTVSVTRNAYEAMQKYVALT